MKEAVKEEPGRQSKSPIEKCSKTTISLVSTVGNDSPDAACHPMTLFSVKTWSLTIFSRSFSVTVNVDQVSSRLGNEIASLGEDMAAEAKLGHNPGARKPQSGGGAVCERRGGVAAVDSRKSSGESRWRKSPMRKLLAED